MFELWGAESASGALLRRMRFAIAAVASQFLRAKAAPRGSLGLLLLGDTPLQFGSRVAASAPVDSTATRCPRCGQHFSPEGRFCPFDGEPLVLATNWDPRHDALLDQVIDHRYYVEAVIGEGGMGRVYRVRHALLGKPLALKALRADLASDHEIAQRFIHEARVAASVSHPSLVRILDFGSLPTGQPYLIMELLEGVPLSSLLRRHGALAPARAVGIAREVAEAVQVVHDAGIVHRDLKPDNIHVRETPAGDEVRIVDFGLAKVVGGSRLTRKGVVFGTPHYMSPEQASGEGIEPRADIYALGVVLYEMLAGRVPFEADTYMGVLTQHVYMKPVPPSARLGHPKGLDALEAVVLRCLEKQPARRYASMSELVAALKAIPIASLPAEPLGVAERLSPDELTRGELDSGRLFAPARTSWPLAVAGLLLCSVLGGLTARTWLNSRQPLAPPASLTAGGGRGKAVVVATSGPSPPAHREPADSPVAELAAVPSAEPTEMFSARRRPANPPRVRVNEAAAPTPSWRGDIIDPWAKR